MKKTKILVYDTNFSPYITRDILVMKISYWLKNNCEVTIFCTNEGKKYYATVLQGIKYISFNYSYKSKNIYLRPFEFLQVSFFALFHTKKLLHTYDAMYSQSSIIDFLLVPWIITIIDKKVKWFVLVENIVPPPHMRPGPFLRNLIPYVAFLIGEQLMKRASIIFVISALLYEHYKTRNYSVIRIGKQYGIDLAIFKGPIAANTPQFDAVYCGRLHEAKGIFDLIDVVKEVVKVKKTFRLGILGDGSEEMKQRLVEKVKMYSLEDNIIFNGFVTGKRKGDLLRSAGFFLFLSYDEAGSHAVLEAIALNKLVIAYNLPVYHTINKVNIASGQMVLFKQGDVNTIASYIASLNYKQLKFNNILDDYNWDSVVKNELAAIKK